MSSFSSTFYLKHYETDNVFKNFVFVTENNIYIKKEFNTGRRLWQTMCWTWTDTGQTNEEHKMATSATQLTLRKLIEGRVTSKVASCLYLFTFLFPSQLAPSKYGLFTLDSIREQRLLLSQLDTSIITNIKVFSISFQGQFDLFCLWN